MKLLLTTILLASAIWSSAEAQDIPRHRRIPVTFYCVDGVNPGSMAQEHCLDLIRRTRAHYRETANIAIIARRVERIGEPAPWLIGSPANGLAYLRHLESIFAGSYPRRIKYVVGQPWIDSSGTSWLLGYANTVCNVGPNRMPGAVAYSLASYGNHRGENRYWHSLNALIHELGHSVGAEHSETGIMHANAMSFVTEGILSWSDINFGWINACLKRRK